MKNTFVKDLRNLEGSTIQEKFVVISKLNRTTRKGKSYWQLVLADSSGQVAGRIWNNFSRAGEAFESGNILEVAAKVESYAGELQLNLEKFRRLSVSEFELADFPKGTTGENDDFAELAKFEVAAGTWVMTDLSSEVALRSREATEKFKEKYLNPSQKGPKPQEKPSKIITRSVSQSSEDTEERTRELKRKYVRKPEDH
jgi:hypothetical protein